MNKKFSTLVATLLLSGALVSVNATDVKTLADFKADATTYTVTNMGDSKIDFLADISLDESTPYLLIDQNNLIIDGHGKIFTGRLVITGENVTVKNLTILNKTTSNASSYHKNAITVVSSSVTIIDNNIICDGGVNLLANGISIFPTDADAKIVVKGNVFKNAKTINDKWQSSAIIVAEDIALPTGGETKSAELTDFDVASISNNTFENCAVDYLYKDYATDDNKGYKSVQVTPVKGTNGEYLNADYIKALVTSTPADADVIFNGSSEDLLEALADVDVTAANVAIECTDNNVLYGEAKNPNNGKLPVIAAVAPAKSDVFGYALEEKETSDYSMLILSSANGFAYIINIDGTNTASATAATETNIKEYATNPAALWKMTRGQESDGRYYYKFVNKNGVQLKSVTNAGTGTNGTFYPENNAVYNKGVVFAVNGLTLNDNTPASFGLYKAGNNVLSVADLMWFENDGFSVTIKYLNEDGEFKKEDIAGNPFQKHLTPMYWNGSKFVDFGTTTKDEDSFYLKDVEGNYIVAQKYASSGSVTSQSNYTFTTVSETVLTHDILRKEGNYFGEFRAEVSAKYTDYTKLEAIDVLRVNLAAGWAEVGRLDLGTKEVPTLAASVSTVLKPILVSLGSNKVVDPKDFLVKNKFYTVTKLDAKGKVLGKLAVADDLYNGDGHTYCEFVTSYGNVLEGQFALTYEEGQYVFTNREAPNYKWSLAANTLYEGESENLYVSGNVIYKIETVESHSSNDGYETLSDVKNNKFHIGFSSNVFGENAWFTENHEGTDNHTIGLNIDQEDALIFTATEYAAARKIDHDKVNTHKDIYVPTDSIYVISTMGYYSGKDYKETKDTLKVVSYSFVNQFTEPLVYDKNRYVSQVYKDEDTKKRYESVEEAAKDAQKFTLRVDNGKLNLRPVINEVASMTEEQYATWGDASMYQVFNAWDEYSKVYAGDATNGILNTTWIYNRTENDLFVVEPTEKPMYRPVVNALDTISIFRNDNPKSVLFEDGGFLGMENLAQYPSIAPAMVADTAYVRNNTYRPQYMLVVDPKITPAGKWCPIHGDDPTCPDAHKVESKGWVEGRYLVNLVDTAIAWDIANKHKDNNPYINTEKYYRLGFVQAKHIEDSLVIASTNDTLMVGTEDYNQAKFAFRYVDTDAKSFRIETANYNRLPGATKAVRDGEGYVKWMNGVVVVVDDIIDGDVFNMNEEEEGMPTANEGVSTSDVSVIASDGEVIINGAQGKKVTISNVLGQTVANTVVTSDKATIAAPAGIVVVAVEGEAAVKAIVK